MVRHLFISSLALALSLNASLSFAQNRELGPSLLKKNELPNAVQLQITKKGQKYFENHFSQLLGNLGFNLSEGYFPEMQFSSEKAINLDDYANKYPNEIKIYKQVKGLLSQWLVGFSLNDHRPTIKIGESEYKAEFSRFGLVTDEKLMQSIGKTDGAVLAIEMEISSLKAQTASVRAWDLNNEFLGQMGLDNFSLTAGSKESPVKVRLPFYIRIAPNGLVEFQALKVEQNFDLSPIELKYQKLVVPQVAVDINGRKYIMNLTELEKTINQDMPLILTTIRQNLGQFAQEQLPQLLNEKAKEALSGGLEQVQHIEPPGKSENDTRPDFIWGLRLEKINLKNSLNISLAAYVEDTWRDPRSPVNPPLPDMKNGSRGAPTYNLPQDQYDLSLTVDRSLINRIMQLSYNRRNFEKIVQSDGSILKLRAAPTVDYIRPPTAAKTNETYLKLHLMVETDPDSMFLKKTIVVGFDVIAKLKQVPDKSGMELILHNIDTNSIQLDPKYLSWLGSFVAGKVREGVKDKLRKQSANWSKNQEKIPGKLELPPAIFGMQLDLVKVDMDINGHLKMYLNYKSGSHP